MSTLENLEMGAFTTKGRSCKDETLKQVYELFPILKNRKKQAAGNPEWRGTTDVGDRKRTDVQTESSSF